jgi:hypothetical protein
MTYASGGLIEAVDYNNFAASVNAVWGTGGSPTLDYGYGQTSSTLPSVAASNTVTAAQWQNLIDRINKMRQHQSGVTSGLTSPNAGDVITFLGNMSNQIAACHNNRLLVNATLSETPNFIENATGWTTTAVKEISLNFTGGAAAMRHFFNGGGYVSFHGASSNLSGNTKSLDWDSLLIAAGGVKITALDSARINTPAGSFSGTPSTNPNTVLIGFYDLDTTDKTILQQSSTNAVGGYNLNNVVLQARLNALPGSATTMYLKMILNDASGDVVNDTVTGTVRLDVNYAPPLTTYLTQNSWGTITAASSVNTQV